MKLRICLLFPVLMFFTHSVLAQGGGSVVIFDKSKAGTAAEQTISHWLSSQIGSGLLKTYPCVDWIDDSGIGAILENERQRQLLGQNPDDEKLMNLAGALGARYVILVSATALPNGQTAISARVIDNRTLRRLIDKSAITPGGDEALDQAEAMARQVMQELAGVFMNRCEPHWTGTVSRIFRSQRSETKDLVSWPGALEKNVKGTVQSSEKMEHKIDAFLRAGSQKGGTATEARITNFFDLNYHRAVTRTSTIRCRPSNAPSYEKATNGKSTETITEFGQNTETMPAYVQVDRSSGSFEITIDYPATKTKRREESSGVRSGCTDEPFSDVSESDGSPLSEAFTAAGSIRITGKIDPKNPNVLAGQEIIGEYDAEGQTITKWNLRLVNPRAKK